VAFVERAAHLIQSRCVPIFLVKSPRVHGLQVALGVRRDGVLVGVVASATLGGALPTGETRGLHNASERASRVAARCGGHSIRSIECRLSARRVDETMLVPLGGDERSALENEPPFEAAATTPAIATKRRARVIGVCFRFA
jgi:hypothetical protein